MKFVPMILLLSIILETSIQASTMESEHRKTQFAPNVDLKTGAIRVPDNYSLWPTLGVWSLGKKGSNWGTKEYHIVYTQPETIKYYQRYKKYPDGAVLVKELMNTETMSMTTSPVVSHATTIKGWFVLVRDTQERFKESPLWGDGWGWSFFEADNPIKSVSKNYQEDCIGCHLPARDLAPAEADYSDKWTYSFGYPVLR